MTTPPFPKRAVLIVDDESAIRSVQERLLSRAGYDVIACASAGEAMDALRSRQAEIALALLDVYMPEMNGRDLAVAIREQYPDVKIVMVSGGIAAELEEFVEFDGTLEKPFTGASLIAEVSRHAGPATHKA